MEIGPLLHRVPMLPVYPSEIYVLVPMSPGAAGWFSVSVCPTSQPMGVGGVRWCLIRVDGLLWSPVSVLQRYAQVPPMSGFSDALKISSRSGTEVG